jgi:hypothetical protein
MLSSAVYPEYNLDPSTFQRADDPVSPLFATHTKTAGVYPNNSHSETQDTSQVAEFCPSFGSIPSRYEKTVTATLLVATLMNLPASVANKRLTAKLNPLDATLTKIRGGLAKSHESSVNSHDYRVTRFALA